MGEGAGGKMVMTRPRPFHLADAMILTSAVAIGLGSARWYYHQPGFVNPSDLSLRTVSEMVGYFLLPIAPTLIGIRLRRPRPNWPRLVRQPGFQANLVVCLVAVLSPVNGKWGYRPNWYGVLTGIGLDQPRLAGQTVAIAWILTALVGRRKAEPGVIDRLGRASGWAWIGLGLVSGVFDRNCFIAQWFTG